MHRDIWIGTDANPDISVLHGGAIIYSTVSDPVLANACDEEEEEEE